MAPPANSSVAVKFWIPAASVTVGSVRMDIVGASSSSVIVTVAEPAVELKFALVGELRDMVKVSLSSSTGSAKMVTSIVLVVSPALNVNGVLLMAV